MIKHLIIYGILAVAIVLGLGFYLGPDDLRNCGKSPSTTINCQTVDAVVAISGGDTKARTNEAIALYKNGWTNILIFSGAAQDKSGPSNAAAMKTIAINAGVPASAILIDEYSETTRQNAENSQVIFTDNNIKSIILVTSGYHQRRASLEFNKYANNVKVLNHPSKNDKDWSTLWWMTPYGWYLAGSEISKVGLFYFVGTR
ncbi:MAG: hypothetical protein PWQ10_404 [Patescibacteria group bacterium]|nr:hypothetical protein [Patescibacteria group bacterium]